MATDVFDELLNPATPAGIPQAELINALRRQRDVGRVAALSGDKSIARMGGAEYDNSVSQATDIRDRRDRTAQQEEQRAFQKWQQQQAIEDRRQARADKKEYQGLALKNALDIANLRNKSRPPVQTEFQKNYERKAGQEALAWDAGGQNQAEASLRDITGAISKLEDPKLGEVGGSFLTALPGGDNIRRITDPTGTDIQRMANRVTVQNLRDTFGPQFTQVEGERFQALDYDPALSDELNIAHLKEKEEIIRRNIQKKNALFEQYRAPMAPTESNLSGDVTDMSDDALLQMIMQGAQ